MDPVAKARVAAALLAVDALVDAKGATWEEKRAAARELNEEDGGRLDEFLSWFESEGA